MAGRIYFDLTESAMKGFTKSKMQKVNSRMTGLKKMRVFDAYLKAVVRCAVKTMKEGLGKKVQGFVNYGIASGVLHSDITNDIFTVTKKLKIDKDSVFYIGDIELKFNEKDAYKANLLSRKMSHIPNITDLAKWIAIRQSNHTWNEMRRHARFKSDRDPVRLAWGIATSIKRGNSLGGRIKNWYKVLDKRTTAGKNMLDCSRRKKYYYISKFKKELLNG